MRYNTTERIGVNAVECIIIQELQWIFRDQPIVDVGIDAMIEVVENGIPSCKFIASQIKSGKGNFHEKEKSWSYYTSDIHYNYWLNSNMPVILIAYIPEESKAFWISIEPQNFIRNKRQWRIDIPKKQKLNVHSKRRLLALIEGITIEDNIEKWSIERIKGLNEKVKNISKSARLIDDLTILFKSISKANNLANEKYKVLINLGMNLQSPQTKKVTGELVNSIRSIIPKAEMLINEFSSLFAIGTDAFRDLITGCKEHKLEIVLEQILPVISEFSKSSKTPISQITELKNTIDKFSNKDKELKLTATILSEVLSLVIREFSVACNITEDIVEYIKEDSF